MALGTDSRFDLSRAYWVIAGIAGVDPNVASVGSAAWANWVVNGDLGFEIDARDMPHSWSTGIIPFDRRAPFVQPPLPQDNIHGQLAYRLNPGLVDWAYHLTASSPIADDANLRHVRIAYGSFANGRRAPFVLRGDSLDGDRFWMGASMNAWAEGWVRYWTGNRGTFAMTAEEDAGIMQSLTRLAHAGRVDGQRVLVLRTGSDYSTPGTGDDARALLLNDSGVGHYSAFREALAAAYHVGSIVVLQLAVHWERYAAKIPVGDYVAASEAGR
jgi:purine nucleoside permease